MALICFTSARGAPGVTLSTLAIAAAWPNGGRPKVVIEADPAGGVLALRYGLGLEPGLMTLAAAMRSQPEPSLLWEHAQSLPGGLGVVVAPDNGAQVSAALRVGLPAMAQWLATTDEADIFVDLGRTDDDRPVSALVEHCDLCVVVARPAIEELQPAAHRLATIAPACRRSGWLLIGDTPYTPADVAAAYPYPIHGVLASDPRGAAALQHGATSARLRRTLLARSAATVADAWYGVMQAETRDGVVS